MTHEIELEPSFLQKFIPRLCNRLLPWKTIIFLQFSVFLWLSLAYKCPLGSTLAPKRKVMHWNPKKDKFTCSQSNRLSPPDCTTFRHNKHFCLASSAELFHAKQKHFPHQHNDAKWKKNRQEKRATWKKNSDLMFGQSSEWNFGAKLEISQFSGRQRVTRPPEPQFLFANIWNYRENGHRNCGKFLAFFRRFSVFHFCH